MVYYLLLCRQKDRFSSFTVNRPEYNDVRDGTSKSNVDVKVEFFVDG